MQQTGAMVEPRSGVAPEPDAETAHTPRVGKTDEPRTSKTHEPRISLALSRRPALFARLAGLRFRRIRLPIVWVLSLGLATLVGSAILIVVLLSLGAASENTFALLRDKSRMGNETTRARVQQYLDPAAAQIEAIAAAIQNGTFELPADPLALALYLRASQAAVPQAIGTRFGSVSGWDMSIGGPRQTIEIGDWRTDPLFSTAMAEARERAKTSDAVYWGPPVFVSNARISVVNARKPVIRNGEFIGLIASVIDLQALSRFTESLATEFGQTPFILYGRDAVLAYPGLDLGNQPLTQQLAVEPLDQVQDVALRHIWQEGWQEQGLLGGDGHYIDLDDDDFAQFDEDREYIFFYDELVGYSDRPWIVGSYFQEDAVNQEVERLARAGMASGLCALLAVIAAVWLGRRLSRPVAEVAEAASHVRQLDLDMVERLPRSRIREIDQAAVAFNSMVEALRAFSRYIPRRLVADLVRTGRTERLATEAREVTVMFTDIAGFTHLAEQMDAAQTAALLNDHFATLGRCVQATGGTIDKFMGDSIMAFWNAPVEQPDHAARALRSAAMIMRAMGKQNGIHMRVGLHSGPVVVGNIGSEERMNYTIVGDTVNIASRLEALGRDVAGEAPVTVLFSEDLRARLDVTPPSENLGEFHLRGRAQPIVLHRLHAPSRDEATP